MRSKDDCFLYTILKLVSDSVGTISVVPPVPNEIALYDTINSGQVIEAGNKNLCNANSVAVIAQYIFNTIINLNLFLVEYRLGAHKESTSLRICTEDYSRTSINLDTNGRLCSEPIQNR
jgi:hypothetical protein